MKTYIVTTEFVRSANGPCRTEETSTFHHSFDEEEEARAFYQDVCRYPEDGLASAIMELLDDSHSEAEILATKRFFP